MSTPLERLKQMSTIGRRVHFSKKGNPQLISQIGEVIDEVSTFTSSSDGDAFKWFIQKIRETNNNIAYRFCYYTLHATKTRFGFGQYAPALSADEFQEMMTKAKEKGFF